MLEHLTGESFIDAKRRLLLQYPDGGQPVEAPVEKDYRKTLNKLWTTATPNHRMLRNYFKGRGIGVPLMPAVLRFHPRCPYYDGAIRHTAPAMLARVFQSGKPITLHRTYLTDDVPSRRMLMPCSATLSGAYIPLHGKPFNFRLGVAEGIETALAAWQLSEHPEPIWSCINAGQLEKFEPPEGVDILSIYGDNDKTFTGQAAAYALGKRLSNRVNPVRCRVLIPTVEGWDWNDKLIDPT
jgi:putative DNA primase/helicase